MSRQEGKLKRDISRLGFSAMSLNSIIGAGIFATGEPPPPLVERLR